MNKALLLFILTFTTAVSAAESEIYLTFTQNNTKYWQYISDKTMGGISDGQATLEQDEGKFFARLTGNVSTENNGGFIQLRSNLSFVNFDKNNKKLKGVRLEVRGNGEIYHIFIRTTKTRSYRDYYSISFITTSDWEIVDLPFNKFKHRLSNNSDLEDKSIGTFGIVAYGRNFKSDVSVSKIIFYH